MAMNFGLHELLTSCLALVPLPVFFFAPGYVAGSLTNVMQFRSRTVIERLLWATALSLPISLLFAMHPGVPVPPHLTTAAFVACAALVCGLLIRDLRQIPAQGPTWDRTATIITSVSAGLVLYVFFSVLPLQIHGRLYESALWQDWNVRVQLVNAAIRGGNALSNPMFAAHGQPAPLHYYYFWYVLCARMHDLVPVNARAVLTASCVGSALSLLAFILLSVKYLGSSSLPVRRQCTAALLVACILGLDLVAITIALLHHRFYPDLQFWLDDRLPGWLHMVIWSPHHVAGLVCCGLGTILFVHALHASPRQQGVHAVLAGIAFAASAGTSTFITLLFAAANLLIALDALRRREWSVIRCMAIATLIATLLIAPFLHTLLLANKGAALPSGPQRPVLHAGMRYRDQAVQFTFGLMKDYDRSIHGMPPTTDPAYTRIKWALRVFRWPFVFALFLFDFGFFVFILIYQARKDFGSNTPMSRRARLLWLLFAGIAIPGFLLNSGGALTNNDLGRHAGFCMRLVLLLWATPVVATSLDRWRLARQRHLPLALSRTHLWAIAFAVLGIAAQAAQIVLIRIRLPLTDAGLLPRVVVEERVPRIAFRFGQMQRAMAAASAITPQDGIVQGDPHSRMHNVELLYTDRQMAASDDGCNVPFGGDARECLPMSTALIQLFGGTGAYFHGASKILTGPVPFNPQAVTPENFARVCAAFHLTTVVASYTDPVWWHHDSWVWQLHPSFANSTARVFPCPQSAAAVPVSESVPALVH